MRAFARRGASKFRKSSKVPISECVHQSLNGPTPSVALAQKFAARHATLTKHPNRSIVFTFSPSSAKFCFGGFGVEFFSRPGKIFGGFGAGFSRGSGEIFSGSGPIFIATGVCGRCVCRRTFTAFAGFLRRRRLLSPGFPSCFLGASVWRSPCDIASSTNLRVSLAFPQFP